MFSSLPPFVIECASRTVGIPLAPSVPSHFDYVSQEYGYDPAKYSSLVANAKPVSLSHTSNGNLPTTGKYNLNGNMNGYMNQKTPTLAPMPTAVIEHHCDCCDAPSWTTEFHGVSEMLRSKTWPGRIFWGIIISTIASLGAYSTYSVIRDYMSTPTATRITLQPVKQLQFPKITVCPKNADALQWQSLMTDMRETLPLIGNASAYDLIGFILAGSGFDNMDPLVNRWSALDVEYFERVYDLWRGNRSVHTFFEYIMERHGYRCEQLFPVGGCLLGERALNCCDIFEPRYVMRRGRCYSSKLLYQTDSDEIGKITLSIKQLTSKLVGNGLQPQAVIYISDNYPSIPDFPRYYLNENEWNRMRFTAKHIELVPRVDLCSNESSARGRGTCFVSQWLNSNVISPFNCTFPYMLDLTPPNVNVCHPASIVRNYKQAVIARYNQDTCMPACTRWDYTTSILTSRTLAPFQGYTFRLEASYMDLQYETFLEIRTTTLPGFVSQIGGQLGLFFGTSIITFTQISLFTSVSCYRLIYRLCKRKRKVIFRSDSQVTLDSNSNIGCNWGLY